MTNNAARTSPLIYLFAAACGIFSGWVNQMVDDALLTALCMVGFAMLVRSVEAAAAVALGAAGVDRLAAGARLLRSSS